MRTCKDLALEWGLSERTITNFCNEGKIPGAVKNGRSWEIPDDAVKPIDNRFKDSTRLNTTKSLPVGISDFVRAQSEYYYVDKTLLIKEFLDQKPLVTLFTRPRRFGKTLNMDMLRVFFEMSDEDTSVYFQDKAIWGCGEEYRKYQGKYPVIFLSFKDVKFSSWNDTIAKIKSLLRAEFSRHSDVLDGDKIDAYEKEYWGKIISGTATEVELSMALEMLSRMMFKRYNIAPIIIIDEYDTPIQEGYSEKYYDEIIEFMRNFFSGGFKDNKFLTFGFLTGILRVAQESIFSGLNNLMVDTVLDKRYDKYFGFTYTDVKNILAYYGVSQKEAELKEWYDGYLFGNTEIYNPWSVINYIAKECEPGPYWVNTGSNEILGEVLKHATEDVTERLCGLLNGEKVVTRIDQNVLYKKLADEPSNVYSLLLMAGYLKADGKKYISDGTCICEIAIPNREIETVYKNEILSHLVQRAFITE